MNYDLSNFHKGHKLQYSSDGKSVICTDCQIVADIEAVSGKISPADACEMDPGKRVVLGKQSAGVDRGGKK